MLIYVYKRKFKRKNLSHMDKSFILIDQQYNKGFKIEEYQGVFSLISCNQGKDGKLYNEWAIPQGKNREPRKKQSGDYVVIPIKIVIGHSMEEALNNIRKISGFLQTKPQATPSPPIVTYRPPVHTSQLNTDFDDVPF